MGLHIRHLSCRYIVIFISIQNFVSPQMVAQDSNTGLTQQHVSGSSYFFYQRPEFPRDCGEAQQQCSSQNKSGVYVIKPDGFPEPFEVFCDNSDRSEDSGWMVILRRFDGSVGTDRTWSEYKQGFGFLGSEFWLGNDKVAYVTNQRQYKLQINMVTTDGSSFHVEYDKFRISDEWSGYSLTSVGECNGTAEFFITYCSSGMEFCNCTCQGTCAQPEVKDVCNNDCVHGEGCFCPDGFLFNQSYCVPENECGCFIQRRGVVPNGGVYVNADCSSRCSCNNHVLTCENYGCGTNANCEERHEVRECYCEDGFDGDGQTCTANGRDCFEIYEAGNRRNGVYTIQTSGGSFHVYCDMTTGDGGWTVFQRRKDGGTNFYANWGSYKDGFGNTSEEFWLGNDKLHGITNQKSYQLRIDITNSAGSSYYALYNLFRIADESGNYRLVDLGSFSGTAAYDSMNSRRNRPFSTYDNDNEASSYNCAEKHRGGWWYGYDDGHKYNSCRRCHNWPIGSRNYYCTASNLNGDYQGGNGENIFWWLDNYNCDSHDCHIKFTEMKLRPI